MLTFGRKQKVEEDPETTLARCIVVLDDIRAYRRKDLEQIEANFSALKKSRFKEFYDMWVKVRPSAENIVDMPTKVEGVPRLIRALSWLKVVNRVLLILLVLFLAFQLVPIWRSTLGQDFLSGIGFLLTVVFVVLVVITLNVVAVLDYFIRKRIIAFENATMDEYSGARDKMRESVSRMMKALAREISRSSKSPDHYGLVLYFDDYENIEVVGKWHPKSMGIFKKQYSHFQVVPKA